MSEIIATYLIHDFNGEHEKKAESIALGLTVGTWTDLASFGPEAVGET